LRLFYWHALLLPKPNTEANTEVAVKAMVVKPAATVVEPVATVAKLAKEVVSLDTAVELAAMVVKPANEVVFLDTADKLAAMVVKLANEVVFLDTVVKLATVVKLPEELQLQLVNMEPFINHHNNNKPQLTNGLFQHTNTGHVINSMFCHQRACTAIKFNSTEPGAPPNSTMTVWSNIQSAWMTRAAKPKEPISTSWLAKSPKNSPTPDKSSSKE